MSLPTPYTVQHEVYESDAEDSRGNAIDRWLPPVALEVHGWATPASDQETFEPGRNAVERDLDLYAPGGTSASPRDRITIPGEGLFQVVGRHQDFTKGPWQWNAGVRINLKRTEG